jgi:hypothetical protein
LKSPDGDMEAVISTVLVARLATDVLAISDPSLPVPPHKAFAYASAAIEAGHKNGVDPWELLAVARNESSFREDDVGPDGKDCGITQTRVTGSKYSCRQLRRSFRLGFMEGARELSEYAAACRGHTDFDRCRFNRYNSGIRYATKGWAGHYWLRVLCYTQAAHVDADGQHCLDVTSRAAVARAVARDRDSARAVALRPVRRGRRL